MKFRELRIGDTFDFTGGEHPTFYQRCTKISARKYEWSERAGTFSTEVGTINVQVYNVKHYGE